jgi:hypothetical protein
MKHIHTFENFLNEKVEYIGPFVISDTLSDEELLKLYNDAVEGYAYWQKGFYYSKSDYKKAYTALEKIAKNRGLQLP